MTTACNLSAGPEAEEELTQDATFSIPPTRTPSGTLSLPTRLPLTSLAPTTLPGQARPTTIAGLPATAVLPPAQPTNPVPVSIVILSPIPGNVVAGNVQVLGSAIHPQFLQYQLEYGPEPNPGNLWFQATGAVTSPVLNNLLGIWNTGAVQDGQYQLRLRVFLRDSTSLTTVVNGIRIQNRAPTPQPSATPNIPRPIAAFTVNQNAGQAPLRVRFNNQSTGNITAYQWNFGDGMTSDNANPRHDFTAPGLYTVTLTVSGPGGTSNVSSQINVQSPTAPNAGFNADRFTGTSPLTVQFSDTSAGNITSYHWNFSDGTGSTDRNPRHVFNTPGTYNVFLTVMGPGGSSSARREIVVQGPTVTPPPTLTASLVPPATNTATAQPTATATATNTTPPTVNFSGQQTGDLTIQFTDASTSASPSGIIDWAWDFGDGSTSNEQNPQHTYAAGGTYSVTLTVTDAGGNNSTSQQVQVEAPIAPPDANFMSSPSGALTIQFVDTSTSNSPSGITSRTWDFGDGGASSEQNPLHTYAAGGTYNVTLTVSDAEGRTDSVTNSVQVEQPAVPPDANFTAAPTGDLTVQFVDASTGAVPITTWAWDFGDGTTSDDANPTHTYAAGGTYNVTLTITDQNGLSDTVTNPVEVTAPVVEPPPDQDGPSIVETTPILPDLGQQEIYNRLVGIYQQGAAMGNRSSVLAVAGDNSAMLSGYLDPFNNASNYTLDGETQGLQSIIDWFNSTDLGGATSFNRNSIAVGSDWRINALLNPERADTSVCESGETPLACELRITQPVVVIISVGYEDAVQGTDLNEFRERLQSVIDTSVIAGVIPVLTTVQPRPDNPESVTEYNEAIIEVANANDVPVYNLWARYNSLPNSGLADAVNPSQSPSGPANLSGSETGSYGLNARNRDVLTLLSSLKLALFP